MSNPGIRGWRRALIVLLLGPLPVAVLAYLSKKYQMRIEDDPGAVTAAFGAMWGLTAGVLRKSLLRAFLGLNLGAALGLSFATVATRDGDAWLVALLLVVHGAVLCMCLNYSSAYRALSLLQGLLAGAAAFGVMGVTAVIVTKILRPDLLGWTMMSIVPFGSGMYLYLRLIAGKPDALPLPPSRESAKLPPPSAL